MGHKFSKFWENLTEGMAKGEQESQGEGQGTKSTSKVFPNPTAPASYAHRKAPYLETQSGGSVFDTSTNRYAQEGSLDAPHF